MTAANVLTHVRELIDGREAGDAALLQRFIDSRDEAAFAELVRRHGPLVLGVCRRILGDHHSAEDAFQATFLLLARKAPRLRGTECLAGWLHTVARRTARDARRSDFRRRERERGHLHPSASADDISWRELRQLLDGEIARLPSLYRQPLILCYLENLTQTEAAQRLKIAPAVLRGRLERGRMKLRKRLARFGLPLAAGLLLTDTARLPASLRDAALATVREALADRPISPAIAALACGSTAVSRIKLVVFAAILLLAAGLGIAGGQREQPSDKPPAGNEPNKTEQPKHLDALGDPLPPGATMRLGTQRHRVQSWPLTWRDMPDGKSYLTYHRNGQDEEIRRIDAVAGRVVESWPVPRYHRVVGFSPDCKRTLFVNDYIFFSGFPGRGQKSSQRWEFTLFDLEKRKAVWTNSEDLEEQKWKRIDLVQFSADARYVATRGQVQGALRMWDGVSGKELWHRDNNGQVLEPVGFTDNGKALVACGNNDRNIYVIDRATGKDIRSFPTVGQREFQGCKMSPDGGSVLFGHYGPNIRIWDVASGKERPALEGHKNWAREMAFSRDGKVLVTAGNDSFALVRDWPSGKIHRKIELGRSGVNDMSISGDGKRLEVLFWGEEALNFYDLATGKAIPAPIDAHQGNVYGVEFAPDGKLLSLGKDASVRTWDLATGKSIRRIPVEMDLNSGGFALSRDGKLIATSNNDTNSVCLYDRATFKQIKKQSVPRGLTSQLVFSPDGKWLAGADTRGGTIMAWEVATGRVVVKFQGQVVYGTRCTFSPDGKTFAGYEHGRVRLWETANWKELPSLTAYSPLGLAFSPDSRMLATAGVEGVRLFEFATMKERLHIPPKRDYPSGTMIFSPSGRWLAWLGNNSTIHVWDVQRGELASSFAGHDGAVTDIAFAPDESGLASSSSDSTILIWELPKPKVAVTEKADRIETAWKDLMGGDAKAAFQAIQILTKSPGTAKVLSKRLKLAPPIDHKRLESLIQDLGNAKFSEREQATRELEKIGERAGPALRQFASTTSSAEGRRRAEQILDRLNQPTHDSRRIAEIRSLELLERIGGNEAKQLLEDLSNGDPDAALTNDAKATLGRLRR